ncbi:MAG: hypothetical protein CVV44_13025 [Spirochaetae bacterium HGW-Spirochaetae-1]|nr:MAG: hypothetical protein CVV44_13025 [Spirochaetae bacterium HGW-Spirochaetae-1]
MYTYSIFNDMLSPLDIMDTFFFGEKTGRNASNYPVVNMYEGHDTIEIRALIPGISPENLNMELHDENLILKGDKKNDRTEDTYLRAERSFGSFTKTIRLPFRVNTETIQAKLENGVLRVTLEKSEEVKPRKIAIQ